MDCKAELGQTYLAARYLVDDELKGDIDIIPNMAIAVKGALCTKDKNTYQPIRTDQYGRIAWAKANLSFGKPIQSLSIEQEIIIPPADILSYVSSLYGDLWADEFAKLLKNYQGHSIKINRGRIYFKDIRPPVKELSIDLKQRKIEVAYKDWYRKLGNADIFGFVIPKIRSVFFIFSSDQFLFGDVYFYRDNGDSLNPIRVEIKKIVGTNKFVATYIETDRVLKKGELYHIKVVPSKKRMKGLWQKNNSPYYQLSKSFHFNITNPLGEFEIVNCEPVTVEELMITQFPKQFAHLIEAAKNLNTETPHNSPSTQTKKQNKSTEGLIPFAQQLEVNREYTHMATGALLSPDRLKAGLAVGKLIDDFTKEGQSDNLKALAEMTFGGSSTWLAWQDVREALSKEIISTQKAVPFSQLIKENWFSSSAYKNLSGDIKDLENTMVYRVKDSANLVALIEKFAKPFDIAHSGYGVMGSAMSYQQLNEDTEITTEKLDDLFQQYHDKIGRYELDESDQAKQAELNIIFGLNESIIKSEDHTQLLQFADRLNEDETLSVVLQGHTDNIGTDDFNYHLSRDRANAVREYLVQEGIDKKRLFIIANGESSPKKSNKTSLGREANRRVDAFIQSVAGRATYSYCREGVGNIERLRNLSNDQLIQKSEVIDQGLNSLIDTVLAVASCVPVTSLAALTLVVLKAGATGLSSAAEFLDQQLGSRALKQYKESESLLRHLEAHSMVNQQLIRDIPFDQLNSPAHYLHLQYRIRSEALTGLMLIITRALVSANYPDREDQRHNSLQNIDWENEIQAAQGREILFKLKLEKYRVEEYVHSMLLNDQWMFPIKSIAPMGMDSYWLYETNPYQIKDEGYFGLAEDIVTAIAEVKKDLDPINLVQHGTDELVRDAFYFYSRFNADLPDHTRADFHRCFPIHHLASSDISQFCQVFKTSYPELSENYLQHTAIHFKDTPANELNAWKPMAERFVKDPYSEHISVKPLSPSQALRILVVLKDEYIEGVYPIRLQLCRQDTVPDINGPVYTDITRELKTDELLDDEQQFSGKRGCVFYPFYKLGQSTLFGAKPLGSAIALKTVGADRYYQWGNLDMNNIFKVCIGKNDELEQTIRFAASHKEGDKGQEWRVDANGHSKYWRQHSRDIDYREVFPTKVDKKRSHEALMINDEFLLDRSSSIQLPSLFDDADYQNVAVLIRIPDSKGEGEWLLPHPSFLNKIKAASNVSGVGISLEGRRALSFSHYDWQAPIEFMMLVMASDLKNERYEALKQDWTQLNIDFDLMEYNRIFKNTPGPRLTKTMHYLGEMKQVRKGYYLEKNQRTNNEKPITFKASLSDDVKSNSAFSQLLSLFENSDTPEYRKQIEALAGWFSPSEHEGNKRHVFAVHYLPEYESPTGRMVKGLRPFGEDRVELIESTPPKLKTNDEEAYRYQFGGFSTPDQTGFACDSATQHITPNNSLPYEFRFSVPKNYDGDAPWMKEPENPKDSILKQSAIKGVEAEKESYLAKLKAIKKWIEKDTRSIRIDRNALY